MKNIPLNNAEAQRLGALDTYDIFDTESEQEFDDLASLASTICEVPIALITFIGADRQTFKSHFGTDLKENRRDMSFCNHAIASSDDIMMVPDASLDARFSDNPVVTGVTQISFYAGVPIINEDGFALGTICVYDQKANSLSPNQVNALKSLAKQVMDKLELRRKIRQLEKTNHNLLNSNVLIQKFASMAAHDIKNPLSNVLLGSQALKIRYEKQLYEGCLKLIDLNISSTQNLLQLVDEMLEYSKSPSSLLANKRQFSLNGLLKKIINMQIIPKGIKISIPEEKYEIYTSLIAFDQIILNLLNNAIRYNDKEEGLIDIRFEQDDEYYKLEIEDNGIGIPAEYHEKIFTSNFTLGQTDRNQQKGTGIGLSTVKDLVTALNGSIDVTSAPGTGSTFFIRIKR
ncbi:GAF domain-containing sensor histidine kinase [Pedobacter hartonius]|uniref:histidine kinase n=1 Tax=Pedobacter hartonius TaxID=425514 RepID=A0A1H4BC16_9SPHI|nr:GAF domain-containing sensor histidine kinase [Pedobacter hartonius]SEA45528.1 GAF sensor signal transduction histidine kinase [Pedobacter hartonius]